VNWQGYAQIIVLLALLLLRRKNLAGQSPQLFLKLVGLFKQ